MPFDFTTLPDRRGMDALALEAECAIGKYGPDARDVQVQPGFSLIPMWVADMNFATVPAIPEALCRRAAHPIYGYYRPSDAYYGAICRWQEMRNGVQGLEREHIGYENGVLGGVTSALNAVCSRGDAVLLHAPTYIGFTSVLTNNGYRAVHSPLKRDEAGIWRMDLADMERRLREEDIHVAILCSPHNPCGRVWERRELEAAMALFAKYDVFVISDEIWSDILLDGHRHIPTQSVSEDARRRTVALYAPSKTFNLAGLIGSYHIIYDPWLRSRVEKEASLSHYNDMNVLSMHALIAGYSPQGAQWVDELCQVLSGHVELALDYFARRCPEIHVARPQGTYMLLLDCADWCAVRGVPFPELLKAGARVGVLWQDGRPFFQDQSIRMNLASPRALIREALDRLDAYVFHPRA